MQIKIAAGMLVLSVLMGNAYAADISGCPKPSDIKATAYKSSDPQIPAPFNEGFNYTASTGGKNWKGEALGTDDTFLEDKYGLKPESVSEKDGKTTCSYSGTKNGTSTPYLKLIAQ
ncbi:MULTISPECIES: hypothetical protein [unclassified Pseudomonas]|uniref:hypothetical protein n=1 Tax=unclassified Pseudomonas TaxID=196821 RepID=UPI002AC8FCED|nr:MULTISPECIES: hypothetical protein [unclassified Pseudomonas]MEB0048616.1 hypothetical protein [Pseudomonas sp. Dout3]MEB0099503.1 hypothetical protein [Pseudomonas sp. DC1.2]WPX58487.1 hypothetical protein RHM68_23360 [Pseudomonas sp. DC1.2]